MPLQVDAVYENGVLRPLQPLDLKEHERVLVSVVKNAARDRSSLAVEYIEKIKKELQDAQSAPASMKCGDGLPRFPDRWPLRLSPSAGTVDPWRAISSIPARW
jgi:predicted DNA-binding antitoxin AbrB/MazE fold protein